MRHLLSLLDLAYQYRLASAGSSADRLHAVVQANFDDVFLTRETCRVWTQFWAFAPYRPKLARLHKINRARVKSNIVSPLKSLVSKEDVQVMTNAIQGYMDGIWIQVAQTKDNFDLNAIQSEAVRFIDQVINSRTTP